MKCINNSDYSCPIRKQVLPLWVLARCSSIETQNSVSIVLQLHAAWYNHPQLMSTHSTAVMPFKCETLIVVNSLIESFSLRLSIHFLLSLTTRVKCCPVTDFLMTVACLLPLIDEQRCDIKRQSHFDNQGSWKWNIYFLLLKSTQSFLEAQLMGTTSWLLLEGPMFRPVVLQPL